MEPEPLAAADVGDAGKVVDRPGVDRRRGADDVARSHAGGTVSADAALEFAEVHPVCVVDRHLAQRAAAEAEQLEGLLDTAVYLGRCVEHRASGEIADAVG